MAVRDRAPRPVRRARAPGRSGSRCAARQRRTGSVSSAHAVELDHGRRVPQVRDWVRLYLRSDDLAESCTARIRRCGSRRGRASGPAGCSSRWLLAAPSLLVAARLVPGVAVGGFGGAVVATLAIAVLNAIMPPIVAACGSRSWRCSGSADPARSTRRCSMLVSAIAPDAIQVDSFGWALARRAGRFGRRRHPGHRLRDERRRHVHAARHPAHRQAHGRRHADGRSRPDLPGDRRSGTPRAPAGDARRERPDTWRRGWPRARTACVEWEPDLSSQTGASQAGILLGSNDDIPAFRWVDKETGRVIACSGPATTARRSSRRRRPGSGCSSNGGREPREPALGRGGRGDPDRQPGERREAGEPRLPGVLRERVQRHAHARPVLLGGRARVERGAPRGPARRAAARPPRRDVPACCARPSASSSAT